MELLMQLTYLFIIHLCIVIVVDRIEFVESIKSIIGLHGKSIPPFDCSLCLTFWICSYIAYFHFEYNIIYAVFSGLILSQLNEVTLKFINIIYWFLEVIIDKLIDLIAKFVDNE